MLTPQPYGEVYVVTNTVNGKRYVGQTTQGAAVRWSHHRGRAGCDPWAFSRALKKYGCGAFTWEVVDTAADQAELDGKETLWIAYFKCVSPNGYNLTTGGLGGKPSEETRRKQSAQRLGKPHTVEWNRKIGDANRTRVWTVEARVKVGDSRRGRKQPPNAVATVAASNTGRKRSAETKEKIRQALLGKTGRVHSAETKAKISAALLDRKRVNRPGD